MKSGKEDDIKNVSESIRSSTWGGILWNSCLYFNNLLAENWLRYCDAYSDFNLKKTKNEITLTNLTRRREKLTRYINGLRKDIRDSSRHMTSIYSEYIALEVDKSLVKSARKYKLAQKRNDMSLLSQFSEDMASYNVAIKLRRDKKHEYDAARERNYKAEQRYKQFMERNKDKTRQLTSKIKKIRKLVDKCKLLNSCDFSGDKDHLYGFFKSQRLAERLLITTYSILSKIHGYSFKTIFSNSEKDMVAEAYFDNLMMGRFNFDYIIACYDIKDGTAVRIPDDKLVKTIYNGYFVTIKGGLNKAFYSVLNERRNIISLNETTHDDDADKMNWYSNPENRAKNDCPTDSTLPRPKMILNQYVVDDASKNYWRVLRNELLNNIQSMTADFRNEYVASHPLMTQHGDNMCGNIPGVFAGIIEKINGELMSDRMLGIKLAHIIIDTMGGVRNRGERVFLVDTINKIIRTHICRCFVSVLRDGVGNEVDIMFSDDKTRQLFYQFAERQTV